MLENESKVQALAISKKELRKNKVHQKIKLAG